MSELNTILKCEHEELMHKTKFIFWSELSAGSAFPQLTGPYATNRNNVLTNEDIIEDKNLHALHRLISTRAIWQKEKRWRMQYLQTTS